MKDTSKLIEKYTKTLESIERELASNSATATKAKEVMTAFIAGDENTFGKELDTLSIIITHRRLSFILGKGENAKVFTDLKGDTTAHGKITTYFETLESLYTSTLDKNGNAKIICTDKKRATEIISELSEIAGGKGEDIVQECALCILKTIRDGEKNGDTFTEDYLLKPVYVLDKRTTHYSNGRLKPENLWLYRPTTAIRTARNCISKYVDSEKNKGKNETSYNALANSIGEEVTPDYNCLLVGIDGEGEKPRKDTFNAKSIPQKANLTAKQKRVYNLRYIAGLSTLQIAKHLGKDETTIEDMLRRITTTIIESGCIEGATAEKRNTAHTATAVVCYLATDTERTTVAHVFDSIGNASATLGIDKGLISKVIKGERKTAGGYIFTKA